MSYYLGITAEVVSMFYSRREKSLFFTSDQWGIGHPVSYQIL